MKSLLSSIDVVIECRDYRVPLTSRNPLLEESLAGRRRLVVYTKRDLGSNGTEVDRLREAKLKQWNRPAPVFFSDHRRKADVRSILDYEKHASGSALSLTGSRALVVGMPNVGKSSLLNALRLVGVGKGKAARTGAQPGVTRKIGTSVKIADGDDGQEGLYVLDTPGVFMPYVPDAESMLKLALCANVKDTIVLPVMLADYLLYHMNLRSPAMYATYHEPTNDIVALLAAVGRKTGRLRKGGEPDLEATALWIVQRWRNGMLGRFVLDDVSDEALQSAPGTPLSYSQRVKAHKTARKAKAKLKKPSSPGAT